jgi:hypothetical protein
MSGLGELLASGCDVRDKLIAYNRLEATMCKFPDLSEEIAKELKGRYAGLKAQLDQYVCILSRETSNILT